MSEKLLDILKPKGDCIPEELLIRYAEGKLSAAEARRVEEHVSECEFCSDALDGIMQNGNAYHFHSQLSSIKKIVHKKVRRSEASETFPIVRTLGIAATLLLLAISTWYVQHVVNNDSQKVFSHEFAPYPIPQIEDNPAPPTPAITEKKLQTQPKKNSSQKITLPNSAPRQKEKKESDQTAAEYSAKNAETLDKPVSPTVNDDADIAVQEEQSKKKSNADTVITLTNSSAAYSTAAPPQTMTWNGSRSAISEDKSTESVAPDSYKKDILPNFNNAMSLYQSNRYAEAIAEFQLVLQQEPSNPASNFYSGVSALALKNPDAALKYFKKTDYKSCQYYEATLWYEALSYISKDDKKEAKKLLQKVAELNGEYKMKAEETMKQL